MHKDYVLNYICVPYSHDDNRVRETRVDVACQYSYFMMEREHLHDVPEVHYNPIAMGANVIRNHTPLKAFNIPQCDFLEQRILPIVDNVVVLCLPAWKRSLGIQREIELASHLHKDIIYVSMQKLLDLGVVSPACKDFLEAIDGADY